MALEMNDIMALKALNEDTAEIYKKIENTLEINNTILWNSDYPVCLQEMKQQELMNADVFMRKLCALKHALLLLKEGFHYGKK